MAGRVRIPIEAVQDLARRVGQFDPAPVPVGSMSSDEAIASGMDPYNVQCERARSAVLKSFDCGSFFIVSFWIEDGIIQMQADSANWPDLDLDKIILLLQQDISKRKQRPFAKP